MQGRMSVAYYQGNRLLGEEPVFDEPSDLDGIIESEEVGALLIESGIIQEPMTETEYLGADLITVDHYDLNGKKLTSDVIYI